MLRALADELGAVLISVEDEHDWRVGGRRASRARWRTRGRSAIDTAPGMWPRRRRRSGRTSTTNAPPRSQAAPHRPRRARASGGTVPYSRGPARFTSGRRRKYGGKVPKPSRSCLTNASSSGACEQGLRRVRVRWSWCAPRRRGGAERPRPVGRIDGQVVGEASGSRSCSDRHSSRASSSVWSGPMRSVRPTVSTSSEPPENKASGVGAVEQQIARCSGVWPGVASAAQREPSEIDLLAVGDACGPRSRGRPCGSEQRGADVRRARARRTRSPRGVGLGREGDVETSAFGLREIAAGMPGGVDDERPAVAEIDEVRGVAETVVDERDRLQVAGRASSHPKPPRVATVFGHRAYRQPPLSRVRLST